MAEMSTWKQCSSCKKEIPFSTTYQVCSVSTCNRKRTGMVFCSVGCWEMHLPMMRHREAWAVEKRSPSKAQWEHELEQERAEGSSSSSSPSSSSSSSSSAPAVRRLTSMPARPVGTIGSRAASDVGDRPPPDKPPPRPASVSSESGAGSNSADSSSAGSSSAGSSSATSSSATSSTPASSNPASSNPAASAEMPASTAAAMAAPSPHQDDGFLDVDESEMPRDILIVVSKLKKYIRARSGFNTSDGVMSVLSDHVRAICRQAIRNAARDERKTVLDRDIPRPPRN